MGFFVAPKLIDESSVDLIVAVIATHFSWDEDKILDLPIDKAMNYLESIREINKPDN